MTLPIAVLISGTGSNLEAILQAIDDGRCDARVCAVLSDRSTAKGLELARERGIPVEVVRLKQFDDRAAWDAALAERVGERDPALVVLAGFMKIVGPAMIARFPSRIINVHPALLPAFPGAHAPADAIAAGVRVSGCTVHVVDAGVDTGPILAQAVVPVQQDDEPDSLHRRIQVAEHALLPAVVHAVATGALELSPTPRLRDPDALRGPDAAVLYSPPLVS